MKPFGQWPTALLHRTVLENLSGVKSVFSDAGFLCL
jgi:hypothetical protein